MSAVNCKFHPNIVASEICDKCHAPLCLNDIRRLNVGSERWANIKVFCPDCEQIMKAHKRKNLILFIVGGLLLAVIILFIEFALY